MKKLLTAAACVLLGCGDSTSPASKVAVSAVTDVSSIVVGSPVSITLSVFNRGDAPLTLFLDGCPQLPFEVLDAQGNVVGPALPQVCSLALYPPRVVEPGGSLTHTVTWSGEGSIGPADEIVYLAPGAYTIRPRVLVQENSYAYGTPVSITLKDVCACSVRTPPPDARSR